MDSTSKKTREELRKKLRQKIRQNKNQRSTKSVRSHRINQLKEKGNDKSTVEQDELMQHIYKNAAKGAKNQNEMIQNVFQQMNKLGINMDNNVDKKNVHDLTPKKITEVEQLQFVPSKVDTADLINQGMDEDLINQEMDTADLIYQGMDEDLINQEMDTADLINQGMDEDLINQEMDTADLINQGMEPVFTVKDIEKQKLEVADAEKKSKVAFENLEKIRREIAMSKNK